MSVEYFENKAKELNLIVNSSEFATVLDSEDELKEFRNKFIIPDAPVNCGREKVLYFVGNSLGLQPIGLNNAIQTQLNKWSTQAVEGHFLQPTPWVSIDDIVVKSSANLVGAKDSEVVIMNTLTSNLHFMLSAFYRPTNKKFKILTEKKAFPSDTHAVVSQIKLHNYDPNIALIEVSPREGEETLHMQDILDVIFIHFYSFY